MKKLIKYKKIIVLFIITRSILFGILIYNRLSDDSINLLINNSSKLRYINSKIILFHLILLAISFILSFIGIGIIILLLYLFFEGVTIGFMLSYFLSVYKIKGIVYSVSYILIYKSLMIFLLIILIFKYLKLFRIIVKYIKNKQINISKTIMNSIIIIFTIIINDLFLILFGKNLLNLFTFYLK